MATTVGSADLIRSADRLRRWWEVLKYAAIPSEVLAELLRDRSTHRHLSYNPHLGVREWEELLTAEIRDERSAAGSPLFARPLPVGWLDRAVEVICGCSPAAYHSLAAAAKLVAHHQLTDSQWERLGAHLSSAARIAPTDASWPEIWLSSPLVPAPVRRSIARWPQLRVRALFLADLPGDDHSDAEILLGGHPEFGRSELEVVAALAATRPGLARAATDLVVERRPVRNFLDGPLLAALGAWDHGDAARAAMLERVGHRWSGSAHGRDDVGLDTFLAHQVWDPGIPAQIVDAIIDRVNRHRAFTRHVGDPYQGRRHGAGPTIDLAGAPIQAIGCLWRRPELTDAQRAGLLEAAEEHNRVEVAAILRHDLDGTSPWEGRDRIERAGYTAADVPEVIAKADATLGGDPCRWRLAIELFSDALDWPDAATAAAAAVAA